MLSAFSHVHTLQRVDGVYAFVYIHLHTFYTSHIAFFYMQELFPNICFPIGSQGTSWNIKGSILVVFADKGAAMCCGRNWITNDDARKVRIAAECPSVNARH